MATVKRGVIRNAEHAFSKDVIGLAVLYGNIVRLMDVL